MRTPLVAGRSIDQFIPADLRSLFYNHPMPQYKYAIHDGYAPYGFTTDGLVMYLPLWALRDSSFKSVDAYKNTATVTGALWRPYGRLFDGNDDKIVVSGLTLDRDAFTLSLWVYLDPANVALDGNFVYIVDSGNYAVDGFALFWDDRGGGDGTNTLLFNIRGTSNFSSCIAPDNTIPVAGWYFITGMYDKDEGGTTEHILRVSASTKQTADFSEQLLPITGSFTLGLNVRTGDFDFGGRVGEVFYYNRKLSIPEDDHNFNATEWRYP